MGLSVLFLLSYVAYHFTSHEVKFGDSNLDGVVDAADISGILTYWGGQSVYDFNNDGTTNNDVRFNQNGGLQQSTGIDADLVWTPTANFQILANFTYLISAKVISDPSVNTVNLNINEPNARKYDKLFRTRLAKSPEFSTNLIGKCCHSIRHTHAHNCFATFRFISSDLLCS